MMKNEMTKELTVSEITKVIKEKSNIDYDGVCWNKRSFSHPERTIRVATTFSGIGAPEQALKRLDLNFDIVYACDMRERYLKFSYKKLAQLAKNLNENEKKLYAEYIYTDNAKNINEQIKKKNSTKQFSKEIVFNNLFVECTDKRMKLELAERAIDLITTGMSNGEREIYVNKHYDTCGENLVKKSYFSNYNITEDRWYNDIRFFDASPFRGKVDIMIGGSPCTSYSLSGKRLGLEDTRGTLFYNFAMKIKECQPKVFIYENVEGMLSSKNGTDSSAFLTALNSFMDLGYDVHFQVLDGRDYGVPQHRKRVWVVGFREKTDFLFPKPIPLTKRMYDYLDTDLSSHNDKKETPYTRKLTGQECLRLMGFENFRDVVGDRELCKQAGNSMVVDCIMAILLQMDITKYGIDVDMRDDKQIHGVDLEKMSYQELTALIESAKIILRNKQNTTEVSIHTDNNETQTVALDSGMEIEEHLDGMLCEVTNRERIPIENITILEEMDITGKPTKDIQQVGNTKANPDDNKNLLNPQWGRVVSTNGVCPTITHTAPPIILVTNEVETNNSYKELMEKAVKEPLPLW